MRDVETGIEQTIVSNRIHPYFVQTTRAVANSSEGHTYTGPLENGHWVDAAELKSGDRLLNDDGTWAAVVGVEVEAEPLTAFNLTVAEFHTYFVAANENAAPVWVHNDCWDDLPSGSTVTTRTTSDGRTIYEGPNGEEIYQGADGRYYDSNVYAPTDTNSADNVDPSTPVGRRDGFDDASSDGPQPDGSGQSNPQLQVPSPTNSPAVINGRSYSGHALDRMQGRGLTPTVIDSTIKPENVVETVDGVTTYVDPVNNVTAIVNDVTGNVITVY